MALLGPGYVIDGPLPVPPPYGLLKVATVLEDLDPHALSGVAVYPYPVSLPVTFDPCSSGTYREKDEGDPVPLPEFGGFTVFNAITCSALGIGSEDEFQRRARVAFAATEGFGVEREFSQGTALTDTPFLADANAQVLAAGAAKGTQEAIALLEDAIGATGRMGVIHATPGTVSAWSRDFLVFKTGDRLFTVNGTPVVSGGGYIGATPEGEAAPAADQAWAYATGPVQVRRDQAEIVPGSLREALDRASNTVTFRAERNYVVDWDTALQAAVLVDRET